MAQDRRVVMEAVKQHGFVLECASEELKRDQVFVKELIKFNPDVLQYDSPALKRIKTS